MATGRRRHEGGWLPAQAFTISELSTALAVVDDGGHGQCDVLRSSDSSRATTELAVTAAQQRQQRLPPSSLLSLLFPRYNNLAASPEPPEISRGGGGGRRGRPLPARVPVCEWPGRRRAAAAVFAGLAEAAAVIRRAAPPSTASREGAGAARGSKSQVGKGPQERNFRFNGQLRPRRRQRGSGREQQQHSIPRVRQSTSTQATDDENARPTRHGGSGLQHRGSCGGRGAAGCGGGAGSIGCRVQCRYTPRVIRTPPVRVSSDPREK